MSKTIEEAARIEREKVYNDLRHAYKIHKDILHYATATACIDKYAIDLFKAGADFALSHQWRSVDDELPADDETVLTLSSCGHVLAYYSKQDEMWFAYGDYGDITPTHWLTIPSLNPEQRWESY